MKFADITGNEDLKTTLRQMVDNDHLGHALLLSENGNWGALAFAVALSEYLNCHNHLGGDSCGVCNSCHKYEKLIHPDLHFAFPVNSSNDLSENEKKAPVSDYFLKTWRELFLENPFFSEMDLYQAIGIDKKSGVISVNESRRIFEKLSLKSFEADYKTMIIWLPEKMNQEASNKLLKLLEEPPAGTLFILVSHAPEKLLTTIRSRCQHILLKPLTREERAALRQEVESNPEFDSIITELFDSLIAKRVIDTFPVWEMLAEYGREKQKDFCVYAENYIRKIYMAANSLEQIAEMRADEESRIRELSARIKPSFYIKAYMALEDAIRAIGSNVNAKLAFCDLCNRLLIAI